MTVVLIVLPLLGVISIILSNTLDIFKLRNMALFFSCVTYLYSIILFLNYDNVILFSQYNTSSFSQWNLGQLSFHIDQINIMFIILSTFLIPICILSGFYINKSRNQLYLVLILLFEAFLLIVFTSQDLMMFYISFEAVLIPLFILVGVYGGLNKIKAAFLLFLYTLIGSLPILLSIIKIYLIWGTTNIAVLSIIDADYSSYIWLGLFIGLAVKTPLVPVHIWLKTAHAEANCASSIILAGLVLKMATYGFLRVLIELMPKETAYFSPIIITLCLISVIYTAFSCMRQTDFKQLIAYSSINHMGIVVLGLFSNTTIGIVGGVLLSLAHGLVSPALFYLVGGVIYDRYHNRTIRYYRGLSTYMPVFSIFFFFFTLANMGTPLTANWIGEFLSLAGSFQNYPFITALASSSIVLSACYSIYLFNRLTFGQWSVHLIPVCDVQRLEFHVLLPLFVFTLLFGIQPNFILQNIELGISALIYLA